MGALAESKKYTVRDIEALPEGERAELIDGEMYMMASPSRRHQRVLGKLYRIISDYIDSKGGKCEVNIAPFAVYLFDDDYNYFEPDISVVCDRQKLDDKGCHGAPDWILEIVSPGSQRMDYILKNYKYDEAGVREYWIVDIDRRKVRCFNLTSGATEEYGFSETVKVGIYEDFSIDFNEVAEVLTE